MRDGLVYDGNGLDLQRLLALASSRRSIAEVPGVRCWPSALEGLRATEADLLVEVTASPSTDGEPGFAHMLEALDRRIPVVTSNKWPVALHGAQLADLARSRGVAFRAESTVMSGTPVLRALVDGLAGAVPLSLRGLLNATANFILSRMADGEPSTPPASRSWTPRYRRMPVRSHIRQRSTSGISPKSGSRTAPYTCW